MIAILFRVLVAIVVAEVLPDSQAEVRQGLLRSKLFGRILLSGHSNSFGFAVDYNVG